MQAVPAHLLEEHYRYLASKRRALWLAPVGVVARYLEVRSSNISCTDLSLASTIPVAKLHLRNMVLSQWYEVHA